MYEKMAWVFLMVKPLLCKLSY